MWLVYREWRVRWHEKTGPVLLSTYMPSFWPSPEQTADQPPEDNIDILHYGSLHGLHAVLPDYKPGYYTRLLSNFDLTPAHAPHLRVIGAVTVDGKVVEHTDRVIRAERMRILALRVIDHMGPASPDNCSHADYAVVRGGTPRDGGADSESVCSVQSFWYFERCCRYELLPSAWEEDPTEYTTASLRDRQGCRVFHPYAYQTVQHETTPKEVEARLCQYYEVPRLPDGDGPWFSRVRDAP